MNPAPTPSSGSLVGLGAGGHARVVLEILQVAPVAPILGLLDPDPDLHGRLLQGVPVLGGDALLVDLRSRGVTHFFLGAGAAGSLAVRERTHQAALAAGLLPVDALHPRAWISPSAAWATGLTAMAQAVVHPGARLGTQVVVNTGAIVEHDCRVGDLAYLAPAACLLGGCEVGAGAFLGAGCIIKQGLRIGEHAVIGAGAVVLEDVPPFTTVVGNPARTLRPRPPL